MMVWMSGLRLVSSINISVYPRMTVSGVRSSCEAMLMKSDLVWSMSFKVAVGFVERVIGLAQFLVQAHQVFNQAGVFQGDSGLVGEGAQRDQVLLGVAVAGELGAEGQQADPAAFGKDGHVHFGLGGVEPFPLGTRDRSK